VVQQPTLSFNLPTGGQVEVYLVKLPDGRIVSRTADELAALPPELRAKLEPTPGMQSTAAAGK